YIPAGEYPFPIPPGALIPRRVETLLPANKNIATTHITNGCYPLHPVERNIADAASAPAGAGVRTGCTLPKSPHATQPLADIHRVLTEPLGFQIGWHEQISTTRR